MLEYMAKSVCNLLYTFKCINVVVCALPPFQRSTRAPNKAGSHLASSTALIGLAKSEHRDLGKLRGTRGTRQSSILSFTHQHHHIGQDRVRLAPPLGLHQ